MSAESNKNNPYLIKKYPNRRLYNTYSSLYITLEDLKQYVIQDIPFKVVDAKTQEDVTKSALIQIIFELEANKNPFFNEESLKYIIKFYDHPLQKLMKETFEKSLSFFNHQT